jgi:hypothetical protein
MWEALKMRPIKNIFLVFAAIFLLFSLSSCVEAPPQLTVVSINPPGNFDAVLIINGDTEIPSRKSNAAWEAYYTFRLWGHYESFFHPNWDFGPNREHIETYKSIETAVLRVTEHGITFDIELNTEIFGNRYSTATLNIKNRSVTDGTAYGRGIALFFIRVVPLLAVAGGLFYLFGYRKRRSWIAWGIAMLPGTIFINTLISIVGLSPWYREVVLPSILLLETPILLLKLIALCAAINELRRIRTAIYLLVSSGISIAMYVTAYMFLPI